MYLRDVSSWKKKILISCDNMWYFSEKSQRNKIMSLGPLIDRDETDIQILILMQGSKLKNDNKQQMLDAKWLFKHKSKRVN